MRFVSLALLLFGCPSASNPTDPMDSDTDVYSDTDTETDTQPVTLDGRCLVDGCDLPAVGEAGRAACEAALTDAGASASDLQSSYSESGGFTLGTSGGVSYNCSAAEMDEPICTSLCATLGFGNSQYTDILSDCACLSAVDHSSAPVMDILRPIVCDPADADVTVGINRGATNDSIGGAITCRNGATFTASCQAALDAANPEFGTSLTQFVDFGGGCGLAD